MKTFIHLSLAFWSSVLLAQPSNVLFVGNSYTHMNNLCKMYERLANSKGKNVFADTLAVSGSTLQGHTLRENTYKKMKARSWDYVFLQGYSRELSRDSALIAKNTIPFAKQLIDSIKKYNPCVRIYYYMTWGYADGFKDSIPNDTYPLMQERILKGYLQLSQATGNYPIAPIGMVWKQVRENYPELNLYAPDNSHPNPYGSYLAACTFFTAVYKESPLGGIYPKKIEPPFTEHIQKTTEDYVLKNITTYNLDTIQVPEFENFPLDFSIREKWLCISVYNRSEKGEQLRWDFGDGTTSTKRHPKHYYSKAGKYTVTLYIKQNCHWHTRSQTVNVSDKVKYANHIKDVNGTTSR
jgi:hypothetical protein